MDLWVYEGDRANMLPEDVLRESFGPVDDRLSLLVGQVALMSALIESKIANIAMSVENKDQNYYLQSFASTNRRVWNRRSSKFEKTLLSDSDSAVISGVLDEAQALLSERNELVHRVWSRPSGKNWGGYKGTRLDRRVGDSPHVVAIGWRDYEPEELQSLLRRMGECLRHFDKAVPRATSLPRIP